MQTINTYVDAFGMLGVIHASQYDSGRQIKCLLFSDGQPYTPPAGTSVTIEAIKPDLHGISYDCELSGNEVTFSLTKQFTAVIGDVICELRLRKGATSIGTANFTLKVERSPINDETIISDTDIPAIIDIATEQAEAAIAAATRATDAAADALVSKNSAADSATSAAGSATSASGSATSASESATSASNLATLARSWVKGDTGTRSGEETDNGEYYMGQTRTNATSAGNSATAAADSASSASGSATAAAASETAAKTSENNAAASATVAGNSATAAAGSATSAGNSATAAAGSATSAGNSATAAAGSATTATNMATLSESYAKGGTDTRTGENTDNSKYYATVASEQAAEATHQAEIAASYAQFVTPHFIIQNNRLYIRNDGAPNWTVANNRLYVKLAA